MKTISFSAVISYTVKITFLRMQTSW